ncbi:MAG TPA: DUF1800 family protein, partial [Bryobacteraceae bacterium]
LKTGGDLRQVLQTMLGSPEFWSEGAYRAKVKTPLEIVASALRASNADVQSAQALANELQKLGEPLYRKIEPSGYSNANADWVSTAGLLERMNFALALAANRIPGVTVDGASWQSQTDPVNLARTILNIDPGAQTEAAITREARDYRLVAGLALGSPEFQRH